MTRKHSFFYYIFGHFSTPPPPLCRLWGFFQPPDYSKPPLLCIKEYMNIYFNDCSQLYHILLFVNFSPMFVYLYVYRCITFKVTSLLSLFVTTSIPLAAITEIPIVIVCFMLLHAHQYRAGRVTKGHVPPLRMLFYGPKVEF